MTLEIKVSSIETKAKRASGGLNNFQNRLVEEENHISSLKSTFSKDRSSEYIDAEMNPAFSDANIISIPLSQETSESQELDIPVTASQPREFVTSVSEQISQSSNISHQSGDTQMTITAPVTVTEKFLCKNSNPDELTKISFESSEQQSSMSSLHLENDSKFDIAKLESNGNAVVVTNIKQSEKKVSASTTVRTVVQKSVKTSSVKMTSLRCSTSQSMKTDSDISSVFSENIDSKQQSNLEKNFYESSKQNSASCFKQVKIPVECTITKHTYTSDNQLTETRSKKKIVVSGNYQTANSVSNLDGFNKPNEEIDINDENAVAGNNIINKKESSKSKRKSKKQRSKKQVLSTDSEKTNVSGICTNVLDFKADFDSLPSAVKQIRQKHETLQHIMREEAKLKELSSSNSSKKDFTDDFNSANSLSVGKSFSEISRNSNITVQQIVSNKFQSQSQPSLQTSSPDFQEEVSTHPTPDEQICQKQEMQHLIHKEAELKKFFSSNNIKDFGTDLNSSNNLSVLKSTSEVSKNSNIILQKIASSQLQQRIEAGSSSLEAEVSTHPTPEEQIHENQHEILKQLMHGEAKLKEFFSANSLQKDFSDDFNSTNSLLVQKSTSELIENSHSIHQKVVSNNLQSKLQRRIEAGSSNVEAEVSTHPTPEEQIREKQEILKRLMHEEANLKDFFSSNNLPKDYTGDFNSVNSLPIKYSTSELLENSNSAHQKVVSNNLESLSHPGIETSSSNEVLRPKDEENTFQAEKPGGKSKKKKKGKKKSKQNSITSLQKDTIDINKLPENMENISFVDEQDSAIQISQPENSNQPTATENIPIDVEQIKNMENKSTDKSLSTQCDSTPLTGTRVDFHVQKRIALSAVNKKQIISDKKLDNKNIDVTDAPKYPSSGIVSFVENESVSIETKQKMDSSKVFIPQSSLLPFSETDVSGFQNPITQGYCIVNQNKNLVTKISKEQGQFPLDETAASVIQKSSVIIEEIPSVEKVEAASDGIHDGETKVSYDETASGILKKSESVEIPLDETEVENICNKATMEISLNEAISDIQISVDQVKEIPLAENKIEIVGYKMNNEVKAAFLSNESKTFQDVQTSTVIVGRVPCEEKQVEPVIEKINNETEALLSDETKANPHTQKSTIIVEEFSFSEKHIEPVIGKINNEIDAILSLEETKTLSVLKKSNVMNEEVLDEKQVEPAGKQITNETKAISDQRTSTVMFEKYPIEEKKNKPVFEEFNNETEVVLSEESKTISAIQKSNVIIEEVLEEKQAELVGEQIINETEAEISLVETEAASDHQMSPVVVEKIIFGEKQIEPVIEKIMNETEAIISLDETKVDPHTQKPVIIEKIPCAEKQTEPLINEEAEDVLLFEKTETVIDIQKSNVMVGEIIDEKQIKPVVQQITKEIKTDISLDENNAGSDHQKPTAIVVELPIDEKQMEHLADKINNEMEAVCSLDGNKTTPNIQKSTVIVEEFISTEEQCEPVIEKTNNETKAVLSSGEIKITSDIQKSIVLVEELPTADKQIKSTIQKIYDDQKIFSEYEALNASHVEEKLPSDKTVTDSCIKTSSIEEMPLDEKQNEYVPEIITNNTEGNLSLDETDSNVKLMMMAEVSVVKKQIETEDQAKTLKVDKTPSAVDIQKSTVTVEKICETLANKEEANFSFDEAVSEIHQSPVIVEQVSLDKKLTENAMKEQDKFPSVETAVDVQKLAISIKELPVIEKQDATIVESATNEKESLFSLDEATFASNLQKSTIKEEELPLVRKQIEIITEKVNIEQQTVLSGDGSRMENQSETLIEKTGNKEETKFSSQLDIKKSSETIEKAPFIQEQNETALQEIYGNENLDVLDEVPFAEKQNVTDVGKINSEQESVVLFNEITTASNAQISPIIARSPSPTEKQKEHVQADKSTKSKVLIPENESLVYEVSDNRKSALVEEFSDAQDQGDKETNETNIGENSQVLSPHSSIALNKILTNSGADISTSDIIDPIESGSKSSKSAADVLKDQETANIAEEKSKKSKKKKKKHKKPCTDGKDKIFPISDVENKSDPVMKQHQPDNVIIQQLTGTEAGDKILEKSLIQTNPDSSDVSSLLEHERNDSEISKQNINFELITTNDIKYQPVEALADNIPAIIDSENIDESTKSDLDSLPSIQNILDANSFGDTILLVNESCKIQAEHLQSHDGSNVKSINKSAISEIALDYVTGIIEKAQDLMANEVLSLDVFTSNTNLNLIEPDNQNSPGKSATLSKDNLTDDSSSDFPNKVTKDSLKEPLAKSLISSEIIFPTEMNVENLEENNFTSTECASVSGELVSVDDQQKPDSKFSSQILVEEPVELSQIHQKIELISNVEEDLSKSPSSVVKEENLHITDIKLEPELIESNQSFDNTGTDNDFTNIQQISVKGENIGNFSQCVSISRDPVSVDVKQATNSIVGSQIRGELFQVHEKTEFMVNVSEEAFKILSDTKEENVHVAGTKPEPKLMENYQSYNIQTGSEMTDEQQISAEEILDTGKQTSLADNEKNLLSDSDSTKSSKKFDLSKYASVSGDLVSVNVQQEPDFEVSSQLLGIGQGELSPMLENSESVCNVNEDTPKLISSDTKVEDISETELKSDTNSIESNQNQADDEMINERQISAKDLGIVKYSNQDDENNMFISLRSTKSFENDSSFDVVIEERPSTEGLVKSNSDLNTSSIDLSETLDSQLTVQSNIPSEKESSINIVSPVEDAVIQSIESNETNLKPNDSEETLSGTSAESVKLTESLRLSSSISQESNTRENEIDTFRGFPFKNQEQFADKTMPESDEYKSSDSLSSETSLITVIENKNLEFASQHSNEDVDIKPSTDPNDMLSEKGNRDISEPLKLDLESSTRWSEKESEINSTLVNNQIKTLQVEPLRKDSFSGEDKKESSCVETLHCIDEILFNMKTRFFEDIEKADEEKHKQLSSTSPEKLAHYDFDLLSWLNKEEKFSTCPNSGLITNANYHSTLPKNCFFPPIDIENQFFEQNVVENTEKLNQLLSTVDKDSSQREIGACFLQIIVTLQQWIEYTETCISKAFDLSTDDYHTKCKEIEEDLSKLILNSSTLISLALSNKGIFQDDAQNVILENLSHLEQQIESLKDFASKSFCQIQKRNEESQGLEEHQKLVNAEIDALNTMMELIHSGKRYQSPLDDIYQMQQNIFQHSSSSEMCYQNKQKLFFVWPASPLENFEIPLNWLNSVQTNACMTYAEAANYHMYSGMYRKAFEWFTKLLNIENSSPIYIDSLDDFKEKTYRLEETLKCFLMLSADIKRNQCLAAQYSSDATEFEELSSTTILISKLENKLKQWNDCYLQIEEVLQCIDMSNRWIEDKKQILSQEPCPKDSLFEYIIFIKSCRQEIQSHKFYIKHIFSLKEKIKTVVNFAPVEEDTINLLSQYFSILDCVDNRDNTNIPTLIFAEEYVPIGQHVEDFTNWLKDSESRQRFIQQEIENCTDITTLIEHLRCIATLETELEHKEQTSNCIVSMMQEGPFLQINVDEALLKDFISRRDNLNINLLKTENCLIEKLIECSKSDVKTNLILWLKEVETSYKSFDVEKLVDMKSLRSSEGKIDKYYKEISTICKILEKEPLIKECPLVQNDIESCENKLGSLDEESIEACKCDMECTSSKLEAIIFQSVEYNRERLCVMEQLKTMSSSLKEMKNTIWHCSYFDLSSKEIITQMYENYLEESITFQRIRDITEKMCSTLNAKVVQTFVASTMEEFDLLFSQNKSLIQEVKIELTNCLHDWKLYLNATKLCNSFITQQQCIFNAYNSPFFNEEHLNTGINKTKEIIKNIAESERLYEDVISTSNKLKEKVSQSTKDEIKKDLEEIKNKWTELQHCLFSTKEKLYSFENMLVAFWDKYHSIRKWITDNQNRILSLQTNRPCSLTTVEIMWEELSLQKQKLADLHQLYSTLKEESLLESSSYEQIGRNIDLAESEMNAFAKQLECKTKMVVSTSEIMKGVENQCTQINLFFETFNQNLCTSTERENKELEHQLNVIEDYLQNAASNYANLQYLQKMRCFNRILEFDSAKHLSSAIFHSQQVISSCSSNYLNLMNEFTEQNKVSKVDRIMNFCREYGKFQADILSKESSSTYLKSLESFMKFKMNSLLIHCYRKLLKTIIKEYYSLSSHNVSEQEAFLTPVKQLHHYWESLENFHEVNLSKVESDILLWENYLHAYHQSKAYLCDIEIILCDHLGIISSKLLNKEISKCKQLINSIQDIHSSLQYTETASKSLIEVVNSDCAQKVTKDVAKLKMQLQNYEDQLQSTTNVLINKQLVLKEIETNLESTSQQINLVALVLNKDNLSTEEVEDCVRNISSNNSLLNKIKIKILEISDTLSCSTLYSELYSQNRSSTVLENYLLEYLSVSQSENFNSSQFRKLSEFVLNRYEEIVKKLQIGYFGLAENKRSKLNQVFEDLINKLDIKASVIALEQELKYDRETDTVISATIEALNDKFDNSTFVFQIRVDEINAIEDKVKFVDSKGVAMLESLNQCEAMYKSINLEEISKTEIEKLIKACDKLHDIVYEEIDKAKISMRSFMNQFFFGTENLFSCCIEGDMHTHTYDDIFRRFNLLEKFILYKKQQLISINDSWSKILLSLEALKEWLAEKEKGLLEIGFDNPNLTRKDHLNQIKTTETLKHDMQDNIHLLHNVNTDFHNISQKEQSVSDLFKDEVVDANSQWHNLYAKISELFQTIKSILELWENYDLLKEHLLLLLTELDLKVTAVEQSDCFHSEEYTAMMKEIYEHEVELLKFVAAANHLKTISQGSVDVIESDITNVQSYWEEILKRLSNCKNQINNLRVEDVTSDSIDASKLNIGEQINYLEEEALTKRTFSEVDTEQSDFLKDLIAALEEARERIESLETVISEPTPTEIEETDAPNYSRLLAACRSSIDVIQHLNHVLSENPCDKDSISIQVQAEDMLTKWEKIENATLDKELRAIKNAKAWTQFSQDLKDIEDWLLDSLQVQSSQSTSDINMEKFIILLQKHQALIAEIEKHKKSIISLNATGQSITINLKCKDNAVAVNEKLKSINEHWNKLYLITLEWQKKLQEEFLQSSDLSNTLLEMELWLKESRERLIDSSLFDSMDNIELHDEHTKLFAMKQQLENCSQQVQILLQVSDQLFCEESFTNDSSPNSRFMELRSKLNFIGEESGRLLKASTEHLSILSKLLLSQKESNKKDEASNSLEEKQPTRMKKCCQYLVRVARASIPIQAMLLLLLGAAILIPNNEEELSCRFSNNFASSLSTMLRYPNGPPAV